MKGDPAVEPIIDYISLSLPLPYRIAVAVVLGVWAWGATLQYFSLVKIDLLSLINPQRVISRPSPPAYIKTYRLAFVLTAPLILSLFLFWSLSLHTYSLVVYYDFLPMTYFCFLFGIFFLPVRLLCSSGRSHFLAIFRRISLGGLAQTKDGKFGDIVLADVLTSYAKIIADLSIVLCMFFSRVPGSATAKPDRLCGSQYLAPIVTSVPSLIRLRQCITEFLRVQRAGGPESGGRHLANALKYASGLPVIGFAALHHDIKIGLNKQSLGLTEETAYYCWLAAIMINSSFSFYWDVTKDWDLAFFPDIFQILSLVRLPWPSKQFHVPHSKKTRPFGLRSSLWLSNPDLYYLAIILDFVLRFIWSLKLSPHLVQFTDSESGMAFFEFSEVARRWIWIFLRSEAEWVRQFEEKEDPTIMDAPSERYEEYDGDE